MAFKDLDEFLGEEDPIRLPIRGKIYEFPPAISARTGLILHRMMQQVSAGRDLNQLEMDDELVSDEQENDIRAELMGDAEMEMVRDGLNTTHVRRVFFTLMAWHTMGAEHAERVWERGEAGGPNRAARRQASRATGRSTRKPASTSGTTSARTAPRKAAANRSRGQNS